MAAVRKAEARVSCKKLRPLGREVHYSCENLRQQIGGGEFSDVEGL